MNLRDYLHHHKILKKDFATNVRYSFAYIGRVCEHKQRPSLRFAETVEEYTKGEVTKDEILDVVYKSDAKSIRKSRNKTRKW